MNERDNQMNLKIGNQKENCHETIGPLFPVFDNMVNSNG